VGVAGTSSDGTRERPGLRRATIKDVAGVAGVSVGTASKALNGQGKLRQETIDRVMEAAQQLGFAPNTLAQALLAGRTASGVTWRCSGHAGSTA